MEHVTQAEIDAYILEARAAYPSMDPHDAVLRFALGEARTMSATLDAAERAERRKDGARIPRQNLGFPFAF